MRARLQVAPAWQNEQDESPHFYDEPCKGADVVSWKQAASAELATCSSMLSYANDMRDIVEAFEKVLHEWPVKQRLRSKINAGTET